MIARGALALALLVAGGACFRDDGTNDGKVTDAERAAFTAPADSSLSLGQVDQYLRTTLGQFRLLEAEGRAMRKQLEGTPPSAAPATKGGRPRSPGARWGEFVDATYVRSARKLRYNPAELLYVRRRMTEVAGHLQAGSQLVSSDQAATLYREQAEAMRGAPGVSQAHIDAMLKAAEQAERQRKAPATSPRVAQNLATLRRARANLSDATWRQVTTVGGGGLRDLRNAQDAEARRKLDELRRLYEHALANREPPRR